MGKPLSMDLRARALAAVDGGMSRRAAAGRFGVSVSSVIRWDAARRETGGFAPKPQGRDMRSRRIEAQRAAVKRTVDGLWTAIGRLVDVFTPQECDNYFAAAGYDAD